MQMFFSGQMVKVLTLCDSLTSTVMSDKLLQAMWDVVTYFETLFQFERAEEHHDKPENIIFLVVQLLFHGVEAWMIGER
jgi:hypothetical protein